MDQKGILAELVGELTRLPGIGRKTAQRLAFHILKQPSEDAARLAEAIVALKERLGLCCECRNIAEGERCEICLDAKRDRRGHPGYFADDRRGSHGDLSVPPAHAIGPPDQSHRAGRARGDGS